MVYNGMCFFDKGWMDGWGATWKHMSFSLIKSLSFEKMEISFFGKNAEQVTLQRKLTFLRQI